MVGLECVYCPRNILEIIHSQIFTKPAMCPDLFEVQVKKQTGHCCCYYGIYRLVGGQTLNTTVNVKAQL